MPAENSIELFNCSLCSFCETSLDGLACHIRNHIKPEPCVERSEIPVTFPTRNVGNGNSIDNLCENSLRQLNGNDSSTSFISSNQTKDEMRVTQSSTGTTATDSEQNPLSPRIEVNDPRTVSLNPQHSSAERQKSPIVAPSCKSNYIHSPIILEKPPQFSRGVPSQTLLRNSAPNIIDQTRPDAIPQVTRYIQLHPREHPFMERPFANQYVANINGKPTIVHTDLVPIAPVKNGFQEIQPVPMDARKNQPREAFYRNMPSTERANTTQSNNTPAAYVPNGNAINRNHVTPNGDVRLRSSHPYEHQSNMHYNYQARPIVPQDNMRSITSSDKSFPPKFHNPFYSDVPTPGVLSHSKSSSKTTSAKPPQVSETHLKQYQTQVGSIQLSDIRKSHLQSNMGVPNNGTIIVNPDQLLSATGNPSMDQLAGILVVPLKKTCEIACQTDPVNFDTSVKEKYVKTSRSVQTEFFHHGSSEQLFDRFRVTDSLFECLVCGDEFASEHHLQEHISQQHTHVCEKCYHSSSNIHDHNMHITDCGKKDSEIVCMECNSTFASLKKMHQHRSKFHNVRMPFRCGVCNVPFETHEAVMKHISTHDQDTPEFKCRYCVKVFQSVEGLNKHFMRHKGVDVYHECRFCKRSFTTSVLLRDHISYMHVIDESRDELTNKAAYATGSPIRVDNMQYEGERITKQYPLCPHCDLAFKTKDHLDQHLDVCSKNKDAIISAFTCDVCKEYFPSDQQRRHHHKKEHKRNSGFRCPKCSKIYRTWSRLKFHTKQQHIKKCCPDCSMVFTKEHVLRKHQEDIHGKPQGQPGERVYTCSYCNTMLNSLAELMSHRKDVHPELSQMKTADQSSGATMLSYIDDPSSDVESVYLSHLSDVDHEPFSASMKDHTCDICGSKFEDEKRLKNHKGLIHGAKPFSCTICKKAFQYSSQVVWHMRTHRKKDKTTKVSSKLWKSKNKKYSSPPSSTSSFVCQFCGAKFSQEKLLNNHKGSVHKIKLFSCEICNAKYGHSTELLWHLRTCRARFKRKNPGVELPTKESKFARIEEDDDSTIDGDGYVCHVCDNAFTHFEDYQNHMRSHPGEEIPSQNIAESDDMKVRGDLTIRDNPNMEYSKLDKDPSESQAIVEEKDVNALLNIEPEFDHSVGEYVCPICQKTTRSLSGMKTHYGRVHGVWSKESSHKEDPNDGMEETIWPCKNCDRQFSTLGSLRHHSTLTHGMTVNEDDVDVIRKQEKITYKEIFSCPYCDISFDSSKKIRVHAFKKHGTVLSDEEVFEWKSGGSAANSKPDLGKDCIRFKCFKCKSKFSTGKAIRIHSLKRHNHILSKKELSKCRVRIRSMNAIPLHKTKAKVLDDNVYPCDLCGRVFANYRAQFTHYRQAHRDPNEPLIVTKTSKFEITKPHPDQSQDANGKPVISKTYPDRFNRTTETVTSVSSDDGVKKDTIECPKCDRTYSQNKSFLTHIQTVHRISQDDYAKYWPEGLPTLKRKKARCPKCHKKCVNQRAMRIHFFQAHGILYSDLKKKNFEVPENSGEDKDEIDEADLEGSAFDQNELRVVEEDNGPPVCFICGRLFRNKRALMTHEYKYHGIRWVGTKRIFPERVRNVPNLQNAVRNNDKSTISKTEVNEEIETFSTESSAGNIALASESILSDTGVIANSDFLDYNAFNKESSQFVCPVCSAGFHIRRAITTHLCRIHGYKKEDIRAFFREANVDNGSAQHEISLDIADANDLNEQNNQENSFDDVTHSDNKVTLSNGIVIEDNMPISVSDQLKCANSENYNEKERSGVLVSASMGNEADMTDKSTNDDIIHASDVGTLLGNSIAEASVNGGITFTNDAESIGDEVIRKPSVNSMSFSNDADNGRGGDLTDNCNDDIAFPNDVDILDEHSLPETSINDNVTLSSDAHSPDEDNILKRCDMEANVDNAPIDNSVVSHMATTNNIHVYNDDMENELGVFSLFSGEYEVEL